MAQSLPVPSGPFNITAPIFAPSIIQLNPFSQAYVDQASVQIAPWVLGTFSDLFLQGILAVQTTNYFTYRDGSDTNRRFTFLVVILTTMCLLKTAQNITIVWDTVITNFANPDVSSVLVVSLWWHYTTSLSTAVIALYVQAFFVYRYWLLTKRILVCLVVACAMVVSLVAAILVIVYLPRIQMDLTKFWSTVHFTSAVIVDAAISIGTSIHLLQQKSTVKTTSDMINRLIRMTWQSAIPPAVIVLLNTIVLETTGVQLSHIALNMTAAKLYAISLMYTLNLRNELRGERLTSQERSMGTRAKRSQMEGRSRAHSQSRRVDGIQVETQISTYSSGGMGHQIELRDSPGSTEKAGIWDGGDGKYHPR